MGINYYLRSEQCKECGHCQEEKHIGKASAGWQFIFKGDFEIASYAQWLEEFRNSNKKIYDEHGHQITLGDFMDIVNQSSNGMSHFNVIYGTPITDKEKAHREENARGYPLDARHHQCWKDEYGYSFCGTEFS